MVHLLKESDWDGDKILVANVKVQRLQEQLYRARFHPAAGDLGLAKDPHKGLPSYYINLLRQTSRDLRYSLPDDIAGDGSLPPAMFDTPFSIVNLFTDQSTNIGSFSRLSPKVFGACDSRKRP